MPEPANLGAPMFNLTSLVGFDDTNFHQLDWELDAEYNHAQRDMSKIIHALRAAHAHFKQFPSSNHPSISEKNSPRDQALLKLTFVLDIIRIFEAVASADVQKDPMLFNGTSGFDGLYRKLKTDVDAANARLQKKKNSLSAPPAAISRGLASAAHGVVPSGTASRSTVANLRVRHP